MAGACKFGPPGGILGSVQIPSRAVQHLPSALGCRGLTKSKALSEQRLTHPKPEGPKIGKNQDLRSRLPCTDPKSGLRPEMGKKWPKNGFWPMAEKWEFSVGPKSIVRPFFSHFGPEARFGVCPRQSGSQIKISLRIETFKQE